MNPQDPMETTDAQSQSGDVEIAGGGNPTAEEQQQHQEHYLPPPTLWEKITGWRGSFLVLSILFHVLLIAVAAFLVVQVVKGREKLKFTAPPPTQANKSQEHKVQMAKKKNSMSAPSISKRITSTSVNANIALPAVQMSSSSSPDLMSSVMSGMGGAGIGGGFGAAGGGSAMPAGGLTAFGFKGNKGKGLEGTFYDLKQSSSSHPPGKKVPSGAKIQTVMQNFFQSGWDKALLKQYFSPNVKMKTARVFIPVLGPEEATRAFEVEKEVEKSQWVILYTGTVIAPKDGKFRFRGRGDNLLAVRITKGGVSQNVFFDSAGGFTRDVKLFPGCVLIKGGQPPGAAGNQPKRINDTSTGPWFEVKTGEKIQMDIIMGELPGTNFEALLLIEEEGKTYSPARAYPVFEMVAGMDPVKVERQAPPVSSERVIFRAE